MGISTGQSVSASQAMEERGAAGGVRVRRWLTAGALVLAVAAVGVIGAAYAYAFSQRDVVARGIHAGAIALGGLSESAARVKLEHAYRPLRRPLLLRYPGGRFVLTAPEAKLSVDTDAVVAQALDLSRRDWFLPRAWREFTGSRLKTNLRPRVVYSRPAVARVVQKVQRRMRQLPVNAIVVPSFDRLRVEVGHRGVAVAPGLRREIERTLVARRSRRLIEV